MGQTEKGQLSASTYQAGQHDAYHLGSHAGSVGSSWCQGYKDHAEGGCRGKEYDTDGIGNSVYEVRDEELRDKRGHDVRKQNDAFGDGRADEVEGGREDDDIEDIVDET